MTESPDEQLLLKTIQAKEAELQQLREDLEMMRANYRRRVARPFGVDVAAVVGQIEDNGK